MKHDLASLKAALVDAPTLTVKATLVRLVPQLDLGATPDRLFTSGKPNRYNVAGVCCVYFAESAMVARAEYDHCWKGLAGEHQPVTTYYASVSLRRVLDLADGATLQALKLDSKDLFRNWRTAKHPTRTQLLGQAVAETAGHSAIRYPSKVCADREQPGFNFVIFRDGIRAPDSVRILGPTGKPLQAWP